MNTEDNTFPRVHTAPTLLGCIIGYSTLRDDVYFGFSGVDSFGSLLKGGYYIYFINFEYCGRPNTKLTPDVSSTNEHWLFTYNKDTASFSDFSIGKMFVTEMVITNTIDKKKTTEITIYVEVPEGSKLVISERDIVESGTHRLKLTMTEDINNVIDYKLELINVTSIKDYRNLKTRHTKNF